MNQPTYYAPYYGAPQDQLTAYKQPYQQMPQSYAPQQPTAPQNSMIWVQGEAAAKSYMIAPNTTAVLWDSEEHLIYIKSSDPSGMPYPLRILRWEEYIPEPAKAPMLEEAGNGYAKELEAKITELTKRIDEIEKRRMSED